MKKEHKEIIDLIEEYKKEWEEYSVDLFTRLMKEPIKSSDIISVGKTLDEHLDIIHTLNKVRFFIEMKLKDKK